MSLARQFPPDPYQFLPPVPALELRSTDLVPGAVLADRHTLEAGNQSPQLSWSPGPAGTASYVLTCFDPDAPTLSGYWHWVVVDLPATVTAVARGAGASDADLPGGFHVATDFGTANYGGAAPPPGDQAHRYQFAVHALDVPTLGLDAQVRAANVGFQMAFHTLARGVLTTTYAR